MRQDLQISGSWTQMVLRSFEALGLEAEALCKAAGVDYARLSDPDCRLPRDLSGKLWRAASRQSGDPLLGLHAAQHLAPSANNLLSHMVITSPTLLAGLELSLPYQRVLAHGRVVTLEKRRGTYALCFRKVAGDLPITRSEMEFMMTALLRLLRFAVRGSWKPLVVRFDFPLPAAAVEYEAAFRCRVEFAQQENVLVLPADLMTRPLPLHSPAVLQALRAAADEGLARLETTSFAAEVRSVLLRRLRSRSGPCSMEALASALHLGARTLQRRLDAEGTSFTVVLEEAQRARCLELLGGPGSLDEIGTALGLSGSRALARAFKRWTGQTPSQYRRLQREETSGTLS